MRYDSLFPVPGGPYKRYPLLYGIPASRYHSSEVMNSSTSCTSDLMTPSKRMIELRGRRALFLTLFHKNDGP